MTGDIIDSTRLSQAGLERVRQLLQQAAEAFCASYGGTVEARLDFYRGDAWQLLLTEQRLALRLSLYLRARLRAELEADTRVAVGLGTVEAIDRDRLSRSTGEAFTLSGRALDAMTGYFDMTAALPPRAGVLGDWLPAVFHLCSDMVRGWTRRQAEISAVALLMPDATHEQIAGTLRPKVTKQTVTASLSGANWRALQEALTTFETTQWTKLLTGDSVADS